MSLAICNGFIVCFTSNHACMMIASVSGVITVGRLEPFAVS